MRCSLRHILAGVLGCLLLLSGLRPGQAAASSAEHLAALVTPLDTALARLAAGDAAGARAAYQAFDDGWSTVEDDVRAQSPALYQEIEEAMEAAAATLRAEPLDGARAQAALRRLRAALLTGPAVLAPAAPVAEPAFLAAAVAHLDQALARLDAGDPDGALGAVAAFRRDWPQVEGLVKARSRTVYTATETQMATVTAQLTQRPPDLAGARRTLQQLRADLAPLIDSAPRYGVLDAAFLLLREGLEALLVMGALLAFLTRTNNADKGRWVWAGGGAGVIASLAVALALNTLLTQVAGANAEWLEGLTSLSAAALLVYVSHWLHAKASLSAWQRYLHAQTSLALARNSLFSLALIAFLAVFREGAETVLLYIGLAPSIRPGDLALGLGLGVTGLVAMGLLTLILGVRLPVRPFFRLASLLVYYLAFKFTGAGLHALQVTGAVGATPLRFLPEIDFLGLFPTWETTAAQLGLLAVALAVLVSDRWRRRSPGLAAPAHETSP